MIKSFIFTGVVCGIAQVIKDNTKLTNGHITSLFVVIGAVLSFLGVYGELINYFGGGACVVIMSFGNSLYQAAIDYGILNMLKGVSVGIVSTILMGFMITIFCRVKD